MPKVYFNGPAGRIEGMYQQSDDPKAPAAVVLHPHPLYGGNMNNKVVYHLYKAFVNNGISVLRINFRGVGSSQGKFDNGVGELADVNAAINWLHSQVPNASHYWLGGFSFGSWIGLQAVMRRPEIEAFIVVAPPVSKYSFSFFSPCPVSGLIIQGEDDAIAKIDDTETLVEECRGQKNVVVQYDIIESADHFFTNQMDVLDQVSDDYIKCRLTNRTVKPIVKQRKRSKGKKKKKL